MKCDNTSMDMGVGEGGNKDEEKWTNLKYILKIGWTETVGVFWPTSRC